MTYINHLLDIFLSAISSSMESPANMHGLLGQQWRVLSLFLILALFSLSDFSFVAPFSLVEADFSPQFIKVLFCENCFHF